MLIIVRHGRTAANASGLLLGCRLDPGLDALGHRQAAALQAVVGGADRVVCSPLRRTRETAAALGLPIEVDERWIEIDYGAFDGTPLVDLPVDIWAKWRADPSFALDDGESLASVGERVRSAADDLVEEARTRDIVVVTHVSPIKAAVVWALGVNDQVVWRMWCAPGSITEIATTGAKPSLHSYNVRAHLEGV